MKRATILGALALGAIAISVWLVAPRPVERRTNPALDGVDDVAAPRSASTVSKPSARSSAADDERGPTRPGAPANVREALKARIERLKQSGQPSVTLAASGAQVIAELARGLHEVDSGCHAAGCFVTLALEDGENEELDARVNRPSSQAASWPGPRQRLEPVRDDAGKLVVTWLFLPK